MAIKKRNRRAANAGVIAALMMVCASSLGASAADAGMTVVRDAATGKLRAPTAEEFNALRSKSRAASKTATQSATAEASTTHPDGSVSYQVPEELMNYSVMTRNADGTMSMHCVTGAEAADQMVAQPLQSAATEHAHDK